ncbi:hypothetical protein Tco_1496957, partial [Tanacetum coccineum]
MSSRIPSSHPATPDFMTPRPQQGFVSRSSPYQATVDPRGQYGPSDICDVRGDIPNAMHRQKRVARPSMNPKVPAFDLGNAVVDDNLGDNEVTITGVVQTDQYLWYTNVDPIVSVRREQYEECMTFLNNPEPVYFDCHVKGFIVSPVFWRELVPSLYMSGYYEVEEPEKEGWQSDDMELIIKNRQHDAKFTVTKSGTASQHFRSQQFLIETDEHIKGTLNGSTRPYPSWDDIECVHMPMNAGGNHWVTV